MSRCLPVLMSIAVILVPAAIPVIAHDVPVEHVVNVVIRPENAKLSVRLVVPAVLLADANLPKTADGHLKRDEIGPTLRLVASAVASHLQFEQDDTPLAPGPFKAQLSGAGEVLATQASVELELTYAIVPGGGPLSARLNAFQSAGQTVRTIAVFEPSPGAARAFNIVGDPERVVFDPDRARAARDFAMRGFRALLDNSDWVLFLLCVALPLRALHQLRPAIVAFLAGQSAALVIGVAWGPSSADVLIACQLTAASAVVVAALQTMTGATARWLWPLSLGFGALTGLVASRAFADAAMFAGSHLVIALAAFGVVVTAGQIWAASAVWLSVGLACRWGLPERIAAILISIVVAHTAVHRIVERGTLLALSGRVTLEHAVGLLTLGWALLILATGLYDGLTGDRGPGFARRPLAGTGGNPAR